MRMLGCVTGETKLSDKPGAWVDLGLTLPIFLVYHLGVVFLRVQNATDIVTAPLLRLAEGSRWIYVAITAAIGLGFATAFTLLGRGRAFHPRKFLQIAVEGVVYAFIMRFGASFLVGRLFAGNIKQEGRLVGLVMSLGAGFYEELAFRAVLFGLGAKLLVWLVTRQRVDLMAETLRPTLRAAMLMFVWAFVCAGIFSAVHYVGAYADAFELTSFTFRLFLGLALTLIFVTRGFAAAVWTHALYDVWVLVLPH
jgi:Type II CAAX prenyl endopeptidase Rce1-like